MTGKLSGRQVQEISDAILNAYGSVAALRMMVRIELDEILDEIAGGESLRVVTFNLITWAERSGRVEDLIRGAAHYNPGNQALRQLVREWGQPSRHSDSAPKAHNQAAAPAAVPPKEQQQTPRRTTEEKPKQNTSAPPSSTPPKPQQRPPSNAAEAKPKQSSPATQAATPPKAQQQTPAQAPPRVTETKPKQDTPAPPAAAPSKPQQQTPAQKDERKPQVDREPQRNLPRWKQIGMEFIRIPAGEFLMGSDRRRDPRAQDDELPQHSAFLDEYFIATVPVTNRQYKAFVDTTGHRIPNHWRGGKIPDGKETHPVVYVSWDDAQKFCQWASLYLPTEQQWEKAARGTGGGIYPWGNMPPDKTLCNFDNNVGDTTPVGTYPKGASPYGVLDMAGNVLEWVADWYQKDYYSTTPSRNLTGPAAGKYRILRGGSWGNPGHMMRAAYRDTNPPEYWNLLSGFRCVRKP